MRQPKRRGTKVDANRMRGWIAEFGSYRVSVTEGRIDRWINQFDEQDKDIAARLLDSVEFVSTGQMSAAFRDILSSLDGWSVDPNTRRGKWRFVAFSGSAGESGDSMLHLFRRANNLSNNKYNELFIHRSDLLSEDFGPDDFVVFVDDFSGTGDQACTAWRDTFQELLPGGPTIYLVLIAASHHARARISDETNMEVVPHIELNDRDNFFSSSCKHFNRQEKGSVFRYCEIADRRNPRGYGDCGFIIVFQHSCPNDSLPILHVDKRKWEGLFRRYD